MFILNERTTQPSRTFVFAPGSPDFSPGGMGITNEHGNCEMVLRNVVHPHTRGRLVFDMQVAFDWFDRDNGDGAHFILMARPNIDAVTWGNQRHGYFIGHGAVVGELHSGHHVGKIESWGPSQAEDRGPGSHKMLPGSTSPQVVDTRWIYRLTFSSLLSAASYKYGRMILGPIGGAAFDTGDIEDNNPDIDMQSRDLVLACIFNRLDGASPDMQVRVMDLQVNHLPHDLMPAPTPQPQGRKQ